MISNFYKVTGPPICPRLVPALEFKKRLNRFGIPPEIKNFRNMAMATSYEDNRTRNKIRDHINNFMGLPKYLFNELIFTQFMDRETQLQQSRNTQTVHLGLGHILQFPTIKTLPGVTFENLTGPLRIEFAQFIRRHQINYLELAEKLGAAIGQGLPNILTGNDSYEVALMQNNLNIGVYKVILYFSPDITDFELREIFSIMKDSVPWINQPVPSVAVMKDWIREWDKQVETAAGLADLERIKHSGNKFTPVLVR